MKNFTKINNVKCAEWGITLSHGAVLDYLISAKDWCHEYKIGMENFFWLSKTKIFKDLMLWFTSEKVVYRRLLDLRKLGLIKMQYDGKKELISITKLGFEWTKSNKKTKKNSNDKNLAKDDSLDIVAQAKNEHKQAVKALKTINLKFIQSLNKPKLKPVKIEKDFYNSTDNEPLNSSCESLNNDAICLNNKQNKAQSPQIENNLKNEPKTRSCETSVGVSGERHITNTYLYKKIIKKMSYQHLQKLSYLEFKPVEVESKHWLDFFDVRYQKTGGILGRDLVYLLKSLDGFREKNVNLNEIVRQSVEKRWNGFYPLAGKYLKNSKKSQLEQDIDFILG